MENNPVNLPIIDLMARTDAYMVSLGYKPSMMTLFRQCWHMLIKYAASHGATHLTMELGTELLREHYKFDLYDTNISKYKSQMRRAVMLLLEYQVSGTITKRMSKNIHSFPDQYCEVGNKFLEWLREIKNLKYNTINNYLRILEAAFSFFSFHGADSISGVDMTLINTYLKTFAGCSRSYALGRCNMLKLFFDFAYHKGYTATTFSFPEVSVYKERKVSEYYTAEEISRILAAVDRANPKGKRDYAMLLLAARYGLRISDIKNLRMSNLNFELKVINITQQKTDNPLTLDLLPDVGWAIIDYYQNGRPPTASKEIFVRHVAPCESFNATDNVARIIGKYAISAGINKPLPSKNSFHMLRFGLASELLLKKVPLTTISSILGHSALSATTIYTKIDVTQLLECALEIPK